MTFTTCEPLRQSFHMQCLAPCKTNSTYHNDCTPSCLLSTQASAINAPAINAPSKLLKQCSNPYFSPKPHLMTTTRKRAPEVVCQIVTERFEGSFLDLERIGWRPLEVTTFCSVSDGPQISKQQRVNRRRRGLGNEEGAVRLSSPKSCASQTIWMRTKSDCKSNVKYK